MSAIDVDRLIATLEDCRQTDVAPTDVTAAWARGWNAALRIAAQVVKTEAEITRYAAELGVERTPVERAAAVADYSDWTTGELAEAFGS